MRSTRFSPRRSAVRTSARFTISGMTNVTAIIGEATLAKPEDGWMASGGKQGRHSEHLGYMIAEMQYLQRKHPGATW